MIDRPDRNIELLQRVHDHICDHPELYEQDIFVRLDTLSERASERASE